jgi:SAM-dependent methyltransferase
VVTESDRLTARSYWDDYWEGIALPAEVTRHPGDSHGNAILDVIDGYLPRDRGLTAAELGGSPGQYLAYVHRSRGYQITCIDYSKIGCQKTVRNFELLGIQGKVIEADLFADAPALPTFDVVYSLGLIEHFTDLTAIIDRHTRLVKPGGFLVIGVPNFRGVHGWFMRRLRPITYATHEISTMNLDQWRIIEDRHQLLTLFKDYIGGFEPRIFSRRETASSTGLFWLAVALTLQWLMHGPLGILRRLNGPLISGYAMAVYQVPRDQSGA